MDKISDDKVIERLNEYVKNQLGSENRYKITDCHFHNEGWQDTTGIEIECQVLYEGQSKDLGHVFANIRILDLKELCHIDKISFDASGLAALHSDLAYTVLNNATALGYANDDNFKISPKSKSCKCFLNKLIKNIVIIPKKLTNSTKREGKSDLREIFGVKNVKGLAKKNKIFSFKINSMSAL